MPTVDEVTTEIKKLVASSVPRGAEVRQLYDRGDLAKVGLLTGDSIKRMAEAMDDEMRSCIAAHEDITRMMREDAENTMAEIKRHAEAWRERMIAYGDAANELQATLRTMTEKVIKQSALSMPLGGEMTPETPATAATG